MRAEDASISAFVAVAALALIVVAGLVVDGGRILAARRQAADIAADAARAGAQQLDERRLRAGTVALDPGAAHAAVSAHLAATPATGVARVRDGAVVVDARLPVRTLLLAVVGVDGATVRARRSARPVQGVTTGGS